MPKKKEQIHKTPEEKIPSRRTFLQKLWIGLGIIAFLEFLWIGISFLKPRKSSLKKEDLVNIIEAGLVDDYELNSVTANIRGQFYLSRLENGGFLAISRKCTHLGCVVPWDTEKKQFICPCHASAFDITGEVISAPASRPLDIFEIFIENNLIKVNTGKKMKRKEYQISQIVYP